MLDPGRIRKRAEHVEQGTQAQVTTWAGGVFHRLVVGLGKHEADTDAVDAACHLYRREVQVDTGCFQQVGTAALARDRTVSVLGHGAAGGGNDECRSGGHVEDVGAIAAGADHVDHLVEGVELDLVGQLAHH
ncbi:hypothetical protein D3C81_1546990 [compost metagenome]